jgi:hypothetical protein
MKIIATDMNIGCAKMFNKYRKRGMTFFPSNSLTKQRTQTTCSHLDLNLYHNRFRWKTVYCLYHKQHKFSAVTALKFKNINDVQLGFFLPCVRKVAVH